MSLYPTTFNYFVQQMISDKSLVAVATYFFACSYSAGQAFFSKQKIKKGNFDPYVEFEESYGTNILINVLRSRPNFKKHLIYIFWTWKKLAVTYYWKLHKCEEKKLIK